jgi:peptidoglycan/xylan/chitin deacetylase (PgdA/CDA1 family)
MSIVTTSWDDGHPKDLLVAELLHARGLQGTFYVPIRSCFGAKLSTADLRELSMQGFEVGGHSVSHKNLPPLSPEQLNHEVGGCKEMLEQAVGCRIGMFCYPNGCYDKAVIRGLQRAGYRGARTVRMLSTDADFKPFEMPTTVQAYPHTQLTFMRNLARARNVPGLFRYLTKLRRVEDWVDLGKKTFGAVLEHGGVWHLYGHSWEIEQLGLWAELRELLDHVSCRPGVKYLNNGQLIG